MTLPIETLQPKLIDMFVHVIDTARLSQAYLFVGPTGAGKQQVAQWIALRLFCQNVQNGHPCGECSECRRILSHNHPDVIILETTNAHIKVDDIRDLKQEMTKTGVESNRRVFILPDADRMTTGAANSLLKFFEEPVDGMTIILTASTKQQILPTIQSRAQIVTFLPPNHQGVVAQLVAAGASAHLAELAASISGDLSQGQGLLADSQFQTRVDKVDQLLKRLADHDRESFVMVQTQLLPLGKTLAEQQQLLDLLALGYRQALKLHYGLSETDSTAAITQLAAQSSKQIAAGLKAILTAQIQLKQNVTFQSDLEQLMLKLVEG